jgi:hypothetical protein
MVDQVVMYAYGGGVNSTALLVGVQSGMPAPWPGAILFADTGGELPETYAYVEAFSVWLQARGMPPITVVRDELGGPLEARCLSRKMLPSVAYGKHKRGCSEKSKQRPQHRFARRVWPDSMACFERGDRVAKVIGYGADEVYRARIEEDRWYTYEYPLISWKWDRQKCLDVIRAADLVVPPKSACFFCPFRKKREIAELRHQHPDLFERAVHMEQNAAPNLDRVRGLGCYFSWEQFGRDLDSPISMENLFPEDEADAEDPAIEDNPFGCVCVGAVPDDEYGEEA